MLQVMSEGRLMENSVLLCRGLVFCSIQAFNCLSDAHPHMEGNLLYWLKC